jgi:hypothetical protein
LKPIGKTSTEVKARWNAENYSRLVLYLPKADAEAYKAKCEEQGKAMSEIPKEAIYNFLGT